MVHGDLTVANVATINVGSAAGATSELRMYDGSLTVDSQSKLNLYAGGVLNFPALMGTSSAVNLAGTVTMYKASILTDRARVASINLTGTLKSLAGAGNADGVTGALSDSGGIQVGDSNGSVSSLIVTGALTVQSAGTAGVYASCSLTDSPAVMGDTLLIEGQVDLYGATLGGTAGTTLSGGTLKTHGNSGAADTISGSITNSGTIQFADALHTLAVTSTYTEGGPGNLVMRIRNGGASDLLAVTMHALLGGTLTVNAVDPPIAGGPTWTIITAGIPLGGAFTTENLPPGRNANIDPANASHYIVT
jgi:hypothetical protein